MSRMFLADHPLCVGLLPDGPVCGRPSEVTDHIVPHHGDGAKFFDAANLQPLCKRCHSRKTAMQDGAFGNPSKKKMKKKDDDDSGDGGDGFIPFGIDGSSR